MEPRREPSEASLRIVQKALDDTRNEIAAGRWFAFGALTLFAAALAAVAGVTAGVLGERHWISHAARTAIGAEVFTGLVALAVVLGSRSRPRKLPASFVSLLSLLLRRAPHPAHGVVREAAALLEVASDPLALARQIGTGGTPTAKALELLGALGLTRDRSLRRLAAGARAPNAPRIELPGRGDRAPRIARRSAAQVCGLTSRWIWPGAGGPAELHVAALARTVVVLHGRQLTCLGADGRERWSRDVDPLVSRLHVSPDGASVAVLASTGRLTMIDGATGERTHQADVGEPSTSVAVSVAGTDVLIGDRLGGVKIFDGRLQRTHRIEIEHPVDFVAIASEVAVGIAVSRRGHVTVFEPAGGVLRRALLRVDVERAWIEEDGERALLCAGAEGVLAWDLASGGLETYAIDRALRDAASDAPGDRLAALTFDGRLVLLDAGARVLWQCDAPERSLRVRLSSAGERVWCMDATGSVHQLEVLDRVDADRTAIELTAGAAPATETEALVPDAEPQPGGWRRVLLDPEGRALVLMNPEGRLAVSEPGGRWHATPPVTGGAGDATMSGDGQSVALCSDSSVRRVRLSDGDTRTAGFPVTTLAPVPGSSVILATTAQGELWSLDVERDQRLAADLPWIAQAIGVPVSGGWEAWLAQRDGSVIRLAPGAAPSLVLAAGVAAPPVRLAPLAGRVLVADAAGVLRWLDPEGREEGQALVGVPVVSIDAAGRRALALTDRFGNLHLVSPTHGREQGVPRPDGLAKAGADPDGEPWLVRVHRQVLTCQKWDGTIRARFQVQGTPLDLATTSDGGFVLLTTAGVFSHGLRAVSASEPARFLELAT